MPAIYPLINGVAFDFSSVELIAGAKRIVGVKSVNYSHTLEPGIVRGTAAQPIGRTRGQYTAEGNLEIYKQDFDDLVSALALVGGSGLNGFMEVAFDIVANYAEPSGAQFITDVIKGARIKKADNSHNTSTDALTVKVDYSALYIVANGRFPLSIAQTIGARF